MEKISPESLTLCPFSSLLPLCIPAILSTDGAEIPMMHYHQAQASAERAALEERERDAEDLVELERSVILLL